MRTLIMLLILSRSTGLIHGQGRFASPPDPGANLPAQPVGVSDLISVTVYGALPS